MRTTITLDADVVAAVETRMRARGIGRSEAVNELIRAALVAPTSKVRYEPRTAHLGLRVDVMNIGEVLDLLDQWDADEAGGGPDAR